MPKNDTIIHMNDLRWLAEYVKAKQAGLDHTHAVVRAECVCVNALTPQEKRAWVSEMLREIANG
jgi:uncharacterized protein YecA (UPF0149 family)